MPFAQLRTSPNTLGIDFGVSSLKLLQLGGGDPPALVAAACAPVPDELRDRPIERFAYQAQVLPKLLKESGIRAKRAACSVSAATTLVHIMRVAGEEGAPIKDQVSFQLKERLGCNPAKFIIRHIRVGEVHWRGARHGEILCTVMPRDTVLQHMEALNACKLEVTGVHCEQFAIARVFEALSEGSSKRHPPTDLIIDIGYGFTKMVIAHAGAPVYAKTIDLGGRHLDMQLANATASSVADASRRRLAGDGPSIPAPSVASLGSGEIHTDSLATAVADIPALETLDDLVHEITLGMRHHMGTHEDRPVDRMIVCGGESRNTELCSYVASGVGLRTEALDPFSLLDKDKRARCTGVDAALPQPGWAVALGLCLAPSGT